MKFSEIKTFVSDDGIKIQMYHFPGDPPQFATSVGIQTPMGTVPQIIPIEGPGTIEEAFNQHDAAVKKFAKEFEAVMKEEAMKKKLVTASQMPPEPQDLRNKLIVP